MLISSNCGGVTQPSASVGCSGLAFTICTLYRCTLPGACICVAVSSFLARLQLFGQRARLHGIDDRQPAAISTAINSPMSDRAIGARAATATTHFLARFFGIETIVDRFHRGAGGAGRKGLEHAGFAALGRAARQARFQADGDRQRAEEVRMLEAELLELTRLAHRQIAGQVAIYDVFVFDVLAIHPRPPMP